MEVGLLAGVELEDGDDEDGDDEVDVATEVEEEVGATFSEATTDVMVSDTQIGSGGDNSLKSC